MTRIRINLLALYSPGGPVWPVFQVPVLTRRTPIIYIPGGTLNLCLMPLTVSQHKSLAKDHIPYIITVSRMLIEPVVQFGSIAAALASRLNTAELSTRRGRPRKRSLNRAGRHRCGIVHKFNRVFFSSVFPFWETPGKGEK